MKSRPKNWLQRPNVSWQWATLAVALWTIALLLFDRTDMAADLENKIARPFEFRMRESLKRSPDIHSKIKIFGIDDSTVSWMGGPNLSIEQWSSLVQSIAKSNPAAIIIDGMFTIAPITEGREAEGLKSIADLEKVETPIIVGSFVAPKALKFREPLDVKDQNFQLNRYVVQSSSDPREMKLLTSELPLPKADSSFVYGPDPRLRKAFKNIGHLIYTGDGRLAPFLRMNEEQGVPHFMMLVEPKPKYLNKNLYIRKTEVPLFRDGYVPLNFSTYGTYLKRTKALRPLLIRAAKGTPQKDINPGDYVYILPLIYTGNTDFKMTPFGPMPGGYAHLAFLNSTLTGDWLRPIWIKEIMIALGAIAGAWITVQFGPILVASGLALGMALWLALVIYAFSYHNLIIPWMLPSVAYLGTIVTIFVEKSRMAEKKSQFIRHALDGVISPRTLNAIAKNPQNLNFEARERVVTIMFIDVVGFSLMAENQLPRLAFDQLKAILADIVSTVHEHGGIVNKYLGDGLLCFFGYSLETDESTFDHAEKAFECAVAIQKNNLPNTLISFEKGEPVYPLRIGINTSSVFLGNLGTEERLDFTIVGNGVNFAKRLEAACETHSILMSSTTKELIDPMDVNKSGIKKQLIQIKHHSEMVEAYAFDPFHDNPTMREKGMQAHISSTNLAREEDRWKVEDPSLVIVSTPVGQGKLVHVSNHGLSLVLTTLVMNHSVLRIQFDSADGSLKQELRNHGILAVEADVNWSYEEDNGYLHGVKYRNLTDTQVHYLVATLRTFSQKEREDQEALPPLKLSS